MSQSNKIEVVLTEHQLADACIEYADKHNLAPKGTYDVAVLFTTEAGKPRAVLELTKK